MNLDRDYDVPADREMAENCPPPENSCCEVNYGDLKSGPRLQRKMERPSTTFARRKELLAFSRELADFIVHNGIQPHELCLLRRFVEGVLLSD